METYTPPEFQKSAFNCPWCKAYSTQIWFEMIPSTNEGPTFFTMNLSECVAFWNNSQTNNFNKIYVARCSHCNKYTLWVDEKLIIPSASIIPPADNDMPKEVAEFYNEAASVFSLSPRSSAALLRLALQVLLKELGESGKNINNDIGNLVKKGLPIEVQQAADIIRVTGNQAVHPGTIDFDDNPDTASTLFTIINLIVRYMITEPKQVNGIFDTLPESVTQQIKKRDEHV